MILPFFTLAHVVISLIGIFSGLVVASLLSGETSAVRAQGS
jgi:hypothetical protein